MFDTKVKALLAVIEAGSYTKAAQKLNLIQPTTSHQIRLLENELDTKIFYRSKNKLKLTPQGKILVQYTRRAAAVYSNTCQAIADSRMGTSHLNVGITLTAGETIVPRVLAILCNKNPGICINICVNTVQKIYSHLKAYGLDSAMMEGGAPDTALVSTTLDTNYLCLAVSPMYRLSRTKTASVEEIHHEKLILCSRSAGTRWLFEKRPGARGISLAESSVIMELDNVSMIKELTAMDLGITIVAKSACREGSTDGRLAIILIENSSMVHQIDVAYRKNSLHPELVRNTRGIREQLKAR